MGGGGGMGGAMGGGMGLNLMGEDEYVRQCKEFFEAQGRPFNEASVRRWYKSFKGQQ